MPFWCNVCRPSRGLWAPCLQKSKKRKMPEVRHPSSCDRSSLWPHIKFLSVKATFFLTYHLHINYLITSLLLLQHLGNCSMGDIVEGNFFIIAHYYISRVLRALKLVDFFGPCSKVRTLWIRVVLFSLIQFSRDITKILLASSSRSVRLVTESCFSHFNL